MSLYYFMDSNLYYGCNKAAVVGIYYSPYLQKSSIDECFLGADIMGYLCLKLQRSVNWVL